MIVAEIKSEPGAKMEFLDIDAAKQTVRDVEQVFGGGASIKSGTKNRGRGVR